MLGTSALLDQPPEWWTISSYSTMYRFIMRNTCSNRSSLHNPTSICSRAPLVTHSPVKQSLAVVNTGRGQRFEIW
ncbi:unnamed protein product [Brassica rapa subsp. narinosa]